MDPLEPVSCREEGLQDSFLGYKTSVAESTKILAYQQPFSNKHEWLVYLRTSIRLKECMSLAYQRISVLTLPLELPWITYVLAFD